MSEVLTSEVVSKLLRERVPMKMIEVGGENVPDPQDPQIIFNSILISLVRRAEKAEQTVTVLGQRVGSLERQLNELLGAIGTLVQQEQGQQQAAEAAPPPPSAPVAETVAEEEEEPPPPSVRATQATNVMPNPQPAPNGSRS